MKIQLKLKIRWKIENFIENFIENEDYSFSIPSEPPKLPVGDQRTWILEVDCFPLLRPGNVERSVTEGGVHMV